MRMMKKMHKLFFAMNYRFDQLEADGFNSHEQGDGSIHHNYGGRNKDHLDSTSIGSTRTTITPKIQKLDFPPCNGKESPITLICQAKHYSKFKQIAIDCMDILATHNQEGNSLLWYQQFKEDNQVLI